MTRNARVLVIAGAFLAGLVLCFSAVMLLMPAGRNVVVQAAAIGGPFQLVDQNGRTVSDLDFKGQPSLVFFGFTHCPDICPTKLLEISEVMRALGKDADKLHALFITVDPERDTPDVMKDYLSSFDPHVQGLTGDLKSIEAVAKAYRVYYKKVQIDDENYTMDHTALVYLMDKQGRFVAPFNLERTPQAAAADLKRYL